MMVEKALAKVCGGYEALAAAGASTGTSGSGSGGMEEGMEGMTLRRLTGLPISAFRTHDLTAAAGRERLWRRLQHCWQQGQLAYLTTTRSAAVVRRE